MLALGLLQAINRPALVQELPVSSVRWNRCGQAFLTWVGLGAAADSITVQLLPAQDKGLASSCLLPCSTRRGAVSEPYSRMLIALQEV